MQVSENTISEYLDSNSHKVLRITFPELGLTLDHCSIYSESMVLKEALMERKKVEFVGCISSSFEIQVHGIRSKLKGERIEVYLKTDNSDEIPLFHGYVETDTMQANKDYKKITAYDALYTKGNIDVAEWYNSLTFPITLKDFRDNLFTYLDILQEEKNLPNDAVVIEKQYEPKSLQARNVIKAICQINGAFGIINRDDKFEYRILADLFTGEDSYPPLYPPFYPGALAGAGSGGESGRVDFSYYRKVDYEDFKVKPVERVTIRKSSEEDGVTYGTGTNNYIIQGNMFAYGQSDDVLLNMAQNIYVNIANVEFQPFAATNSGMPWVEVGVNSAKYVVYDYEASEQSIARGATEDQYTEKTFYIFSRELKGIQALSDSYEAEGEEYQSEFITDLQTQIDTLKNDAQQTAQNVVSNYTYSRAELDEKLQSWYRIVDELPTSYETGVIYFVRK